MLAPFKLIFAIFWSAKFWSFCIRGADYIYVIYIYVMYTPRSAGGSKKEISQFWTPLLLLCELWSPKVDLLFDPPRGLGVYVYMYIYIIYTCIFIYVYMYDTLFCIYVEICLLPCYPPFSFDLSGLKQKFPASRPMKRASPPRPLGGSQNEAGCIYRINIAYRYRYPKGGSTLRFYNLHYKIIGVQNWGGFYFLDPPSQIWIQKMDPP